MEKHPFVEFLNRFVPEAARKSKQVNQAMWILETTGSDDAADLKASLDAELRFSSMTRPLTNSSSPGKKTSKIRCLRDSSMS